MRWNELKQKQNSNEMNSFSAFACSAVCLCVCLGFRCYEEEKKHRVHDEPSNRHTADDAKESEKCVFAWSENETENVVVVGRVYKADFFSV